jgi:soluble lytic murein transglycosylase-like protein
VSVVEALSRIAEIQAAITPPQTAFSASPAGAFAADLQAAQAIPGTALSNALASTRTTAEPVDPGQIPPDLLPLVRQAAQANGMDPALVAAVARAESGFNPAAVSPAGAQGLMQLMPSTARGLGVTDPFDPAQNLDGGARYLRAQLDRFGDPALALAAYNAGPGAVSRAGGIPPYAETQTYVQRVLGYYQSFRAQGLA